MSQNILFFILLIAVSASIGFIILYSKKYFWKRKNTYAAPNTSRIFGFILEFGALNILNLVFILIKFFALPGYKEKFKLFTNHVFRNGGFEDWFLRTELKLFVIFIIYSFVTELFFGETWVGRMLGLRMEMKDKNWKGVFIRNLLKPVSLVFFPLTFLISYFNEDRKWLHDWAGGSKVLREN